MNSLRPSISRTVKQAMQRFSSSSTHVYKPKSIDFTVSTSMYLCIIHITRISHIMFLTHGVSLIYLLSYKCIEYGKNVMAYKERLVLRSIYISPLCYYGSCNDLHDRSCCQTTSPKFNLLVPLLSVAHQSN